MGRSDDKKLPRFDESPDSRRPEIPPPPRVPSISPPAVGRHVAPPMRGVRPDTVPPSALKKSSPPPLPRSKSAAPPPVLSRSAPPPPPARTLTGAPEEAPVERIDMRSILRTPMPPAPAARLSVSDIMDYGAGWEDPDAPTMLHRSARNPRAEDKSSIAPVSLRSEELVEADDNVAIARNSRWARVGYAAVFAATLVAGLYVWRMQPQAAIRSVVAASPQPFIKAPAQLIIATAQPVIERAADPVAITADAASQKASAQAAGATRNASISKQRSSKTSKSEAASESPAAEEGTPAAAPESDPTHAAATHQDEPASTAPAAVPAEEAPELPPFNQAAAQAALDAAAGRAAGCLKEGEPSGMARVVVTFAPSGRVTTASVDGPPYAGTPTGGCIARAFRSAEIAPFSGKLMTVGKTVSLR